MGTKVKKLRSMSLIVISLVKSVSIFSMLSLFPSNQTYLSISSGCCETPKGCLHSTFTLLTSGTCLEYVLFQPKMRVSGMICMGTFCILISESTCLFKNPVGILALPLCILSDKEPISNCMLFDFLNGNRLASKSKPELVI